MQRSKLTCPFFFFFLSRITLAAGLRLDCSGARVDAGSKEGSYCSKPGES